MGERINWVWALPIQGESGVCVLVAVVGGVGGVGGRLGPGSGSCC